MIILGLNMSKSKAGPPSVRALEPVGYLSGSSGRFMRLMESRGEFRVLIFPDMH